MKKILVLVLISILFVACSPEEEDEPEFANPYDKTEEYISLWEEQKFETMFEDHLTNRTLSDFSREDFVERYEHLYEVLEVDKLDISINNREELDQETLETMESYEIPIQISFETLAGPIDYQKHIDLEKVFPSTEDGGEPSPEDAIWKLEWDTSFILPNLQDEDEVRYRINEAQRGEIIDRNGNLLATNGEVFEVGVVLENFDESTLPELASILGVSEEYIQNKYNQSWVQDHYFVPIKKLMLEDESVVDDATSISGVTSQVSVGRVYPYGKVAGHLTGYVGPVSQEELEDLEGEGYDSDDVIGKRGLEQLYEDQLRGEEGAEIFLIKPDGAEETVVADDSTSGESIQITIDMGLQERLYNLVQEERGTAVSLNPTNGQVMSLLSFPAFDPNEFVLGMTSSRYQEISEDEGSPLINRFSSTYSPGSAMKLITSTIGFRTGKLDPDEMKTIESDKWQNNDSWGNYEVTRVSNPHSEINLERAITYSDNIYFAMLGVDIGADTFEEQMTELGFSESLPFEYPVTTSQISNDGELDNEVLLADTSYGQGQMLINFVHLSSLYGGIVNDGVLMSPTLLLDQESKVWMDEMITADQASLLQNNLRKVVTDGSATGVNLEGRSIAGKTGTAELKTSFEDTSGVQNGIFVSYDQENPEFVLSMVIEGVEDRGGSAHTVDLVKEFYESQNN
ncbi:peptidoglycan glycosyltransferase [Halalkalibacillus sediminis]|uniref:serine-type D-Ala-D-Ala carboxypeptidase n=1 Tax=Halalkalibacillus sediminis TaxID=2018042 RepID=A0A2I0QWR4_9BACI|nr:penicillin-binding transpeptidase domain-containing protein [Halalkalibacillus sediminis]PKR78781.1 peptidoglycan glycosyltransferase [Halalkalibacillus sediminis]